MNSHAFSTNYPTIITHATGIMLGIKKRCFEWHICQPDNLMNPILGCTDALVVARNRVISQKSYCGYINFAHLPVFRHALKHLSSQLKPRKRG